MAYINVAEIKKQGGEVVTDKSGKTTIVTQSGNIDVPTNATVVTGGYTGSTGATYNPITHDINPAFSIATTTGKETVTLESKSSVVEQSKPIEQTQQVLINPLTSPEIASLIPQQPQYSPLKIASSNDVKSGVLSEYKQKSYAEGNRGSDRILGFSTGLEEKGQNLVQNNNYGDILKGEALQFGALGISIVGGGLSVIEHPIKTIKGVGLFAKDLITVKPQTELGEQLRQSPAQTIGTMIGQSIVIGEVGKRIPIKSSYDVLEIPQNSGEPVNINLVGLETKGGKALVLGYKTPEGVGLGTPDIIPYLETAKSGEVTRIGTALETKTIQKAFSNLPEEKVVSPERAIEFIPTAQTLAKETVNTQSNFLKDFPKTTERLPEQGVNIVLEQAKAYEGKVSGSFSRSAQLSPTYIIDGQTFELNKSPRDIDVHLNLPAEKIEFVTKETLEQFRKAGLNARLVQQESLTKPNAIEVMQPTGEYAKAVEFLNDDVLLAYNEPPLKDFVVGIPKTGKPIKIEGITATSLNEELRGTLQGTARVQKTESGKFDIFPPEKRVKDISSVSVSARTLEQSKILPSSKLKEAITKFESLYPEELVREQVKAHETISVGLLDFSKTSKETSSRITSFGLNKSSEKSIISSEISSNKTSELISELISPSDLTSSSSGSINFSEISSLIPSNSVSFDNSETSNQVPSVSQIFSDIPSISPLFSNSPSNSKSNSNSQSKTPSPSFMSETSKKSEVVNILKSQNFNKSKRFNLFIRKKGKFQKRAEGISPTDLLNLGENVLRNTSSASLKITDESGAIATPNINNSEFRMSKKESGVLIQLPKFRINTSGEKFEITKKGQESRKRKLKFF